MNNQIGEKLKNKIIQFGDPVLRKTSNPITLFNSELHKILDLLGDILKQEENAAGLAAPQIGILKRVAVVDCEDGLIELINPEILEMSGEQIGVEGCLSFTGYSGRVRRANFIQIKTFDRYGKESIMEQEGFLARCIQHETDHLNGILYIDHIESNILFNDITNNQVDLEFAVLLARGEIKKC